MLCHLRVLFTVVVLSVSAPTLGYSPGSIAPSVSRSEATEALTGFYEQWKQTYFARGCGEDRAYVNIRGDGRRTIGGGAAAKSITVSEAHGYGMLILVMMSRLDPEAQSEFDAMLRYFLDHQADSGRGLMAWNQVEGCVNSVKEEGGYSATDGDVDIAYALLLADQVWGSNGAFDYAAEARVAMDAILSRIVSPSGDFLTIGDWAQQRRRYRNATRSSDFATAQLAAFAAATGDPRWRSVADKTYEIIAAIRRDHSADTGLMPDFIVGLDDVPRPADPNFLESTRDGAFSWNAARYPWRVAMDYLLNGDPRAADAIGPFNDWAEAITKGDPARFSQGYQLDGTAIPRAGRGGLVFVSMLGPAAMIDADKQAWLDAIWARLVATGIGEGDYYGNTLKLLSMIVMTGNWPAYDGAAQ